MTTFKISLRTWKYISGLYFYTNGGKEHLMSVRKSDTSVDLWYFDIPENRGTELSVTSYGFPVNYLLEMARAVLLVRYGLLDIEVKLTKETEKKLKTIQ